MITVYLSCYAHTCCVHIFVHALGVVEGDGIVCSDWRAYAYVMGGDGNGGMAWRMVSSRMRWGCCVSWRCQFGWGLGAGRGLSSGWDTAGGGTYIVSSSISVGKEDEKSCGVILLVGGINS